MTNQINPSPGSGPGNVSPGVVPPNIILGDGYIQVGGAHGKKLYWDQLSKADQEKIIEFYLSAQIPLLTPPLIHFIQDPNDSKSQSTNKVGNVTATSIQAMTEQKVHDIIIGMLDAWIKSNAEIAQQNKEAAVKRQAIQEAQRSYEIQHERTHESNERFIIAFTMGVVLSGSVIAQGAAVDPISNTTITNPISAMSQAAIPPVFGDMRAELGLIGGIFAVGVMYGSVAEVAAKTTTKGEKPKNPDFYLAYGQNMMDLINNTGFNAFLMSIIVRSAEKSVAKGNQPPLTDARKQELLAMVKVVLLSSALALVYKSSAERMISEEYASMVQGTFDFKPEDAVMKKLSKAINKQLKLIVSPHDKATLLAGLLDFFDSNPSMEILENPSKVFAAIYPSFHHAEMVG